MIRFSFLSPWYRLAKDHILLHRVSEGVGESELKDTEIICHFGGNRKFLERGNRRITSQSGLQVDRFVTDHSHRQLRRKLILTPVLINQNQGILLGLIHLQFDRIQLGMDLVRIKKKRLARDLLN